MHIFKKNLSTGKQNIEPVGLSLSLSEYNTFAATESAPDEESSEGYVAIIGSGFVEGPVTSRVIHVTASKGELLISNLD